MHIFNLLKNTRGAIKARNALLIAGAAGAVFAYTVNNEAQKQIQAERQILLNSFSIPVFGMFAFKADCSIKINIWSTVLFYIESHCVQAPNTV